LQNGASEIYLNGKLVIKYGKFGHSREESEDAFISFVPPVIFSLDSVADQVIAVRFSNFRTHLGFGKIGILLNVWDAEKANQIYFDRYTSGRIYQMLFTGISLSFFIIAVLMYIFPPRTRQNLLFMLLTIGIIGVCFLPAQANIASSINSVILLFSLFKIALILFCFFCLWFLYSLFYDKLPRQFWLFVTASVVMLAGTFALSIEVIYIAGFFFLAEMARVVIWAVIKKKPDAWLIGIGFLLFIIFSAYQMLQDMGIVKNYVNNFYWYYLYGIFFLLLSDAIYLAKNFSQTTLNLEKQLHNVQELSAKTIEQEKLAKERELKEQFLEKELEEAKKLEKAMADLEAANKEIRATQSQLVQSEKMASMGMLVAGVAHEINTPIGALCSMHNTLMRAVDKMDAELESKCQGDCEIKPHVKKYLDVIRDANKVIDSGAQRVSNIVKRLRILKTDLNSFFIFRFS